MSHVMTPTTADTFRAAQVSLETRAKAWINTELKELLSKVKTGKYTGQASIEGPECNSLFESVVSTLKSAPYNFEVSSEWKSYMCGAGSYEAREITLKW